MRLQVDNATVRFGNTVALHPLSFTIEPGQKVAVVGPNGSGKSTLLNLLSGVVAPAEGACLLNGVAVHSAPRKDVAAQIAYLPQSASYTFSPTVGEFIELGLFASLSRFGRATASQLEACRAAADQFDVAQFWDRSITTLSGGELQRVRLARTVVSNAGIWLLDEPTTALDPKHTLSLLETVAAHDRTVVASLHDLQLISRVFDTVLVLKNGRVVAFGPTHETLTESVIEEVFEIAAVPVAAGTNAGWLFSKLSSEE